MRKTIFLTLLLSLLGTPTLASVVVCQGGKVSVGDSVERVKKKCGKSYGVSHNMVEVMGTMTVVKTLRYKYPDGTKIGFVFVDNKLITSMVFD